MKSFLALLFILFSQFLPAQGKKIDTASYFNSEKKILIHGRIKNYSHEGDNRFITFRTYDVTGQLKDTSVLINNIGDFEIKLFQPFEGDIEVNYKNGFITLYTSPDEQINLEIDKKAFKPGSSTQGLLISGKSASISNLIIGFQLAFKKHQFKINVPWEDKSLNDQKVAQIRIERMKEELIFLNDYISKNKITNPIFSRWAKNDIIYTAGFETTFELFTNVRNKSLNEVELMRVLSDIPINNTTALTNSKYYKFLKMLAADITIIININAAYDEAKRQNGMNPVPIYLEKVNQYSNGLAKELMYYSVYFSNSIKKSEYYQEDFFTVIKDPYLKKIFVDNREKLTRPFEKYDIITKLQQYQTDDSLKTRLINIFKSEKDRYVFMDFWGDWCLPCLREMPLYPQLIDQFKEYPVTFLFLAAQTEEKSALKIKDKYGIDGKFIVLSKMEENILNNILKFYSYPSHFLLGPENFVLADNIKRIGNNGELDKNAVETLRKYVLSDK